MNNCQNPECKALAEALGAAMQDPPRATIALTVLEAKAAAELLEQHKILQRRLGEALLVLREVPPWVGYPSGMGDESKRQGQMQQRIAAILDDPVNRAVLASQTEAGR